MDKNDRLALAPAAGSGIGKLLAEALLQDSDFVEELKQTARGGLKAVRSYSTRSGTVTEPDFRVRVQTLFGLLAHMEGEPVKRIIHEYFSGDKIDPLAAMQESPELREAAKHLIEKAEWRHSPGERAKTAAAERAAAREAAAEAAEEAEREARRVRRAKRVGDQAPIIDIDPDAPGNF